jgi:inosine-uridine nucleoside N-ribohydrolase
VFGFEDRERRLPVVEHNIHCDPEAAAVVFNTDLPITLFPLDVTLRTPLIASDIERLERSPSPLSQLLHAEITAWLGFIKSEFGRERTELHDPITIASLIDPKVITRSFDAAIRIECAGQHTAGMTIVDHARDAHKNVTIVTEVDISRFYELFSARVCQSAVNVPALSA